MTKQNTCKEALMMKNNQQTMGVRFYANILSDMVVLLGVRAHPRHIHSVFWDVRVGKNNNFINCLVQNIVSA